MTTTMRAAVFQGVGNGLAVEEVPVPSAGERELVVKVGRCGICGTDLSLTSGHGFMQMPAGTILGHEYAGEVVDIGPGVERIKVGDHITALAIPSCGRCVQCVSGDPQWCTGDDKVMGAVGAYGQYAVAAVTQAVKLPQTLPWADGALVEPLAVGLHGVHLAAFAPGTDILVIGAGPIALSAIYWARRMGAGRIVVQATSRRRERFAKELGASEFILAGDDPAGEAVEALGGQPTLVFEAAGVPGTIEHATQIVQQRGTVVVLGWCCVPDSFIPAMCLMKEVRIQFSMTYSVPEFHHTIASLDAGAVDPRAMITDTVSLDGLPGMFEALRARTDQCKVMIDPWA